MDFQFLDTSNFPTGIDHHKSLNDGESDINIVSPSKISLALLIKEYCQLMKNNGDQCPLILNIGAYSGASKVISPRQRKKFGLLLIKLIQGSDISLQSLVKTVIDPKHDIPKMLLANWKENFKIFFDSSDVGSFMDLMLTIERLIASPHNTPNYIFSRQSVCGFFIRKLHLHFDDLSFSEVANLFENFKLYFARGKKSLQDHIESKCNSPEEDSSLLPVNESEITMNETSRSFGGSGVKSEDIIEGFEGSDQQLHEDTIDYKEITTRQQAELYIAKQVHFLEYCEHMADSPTKIFETASKIVKQNSDVPEAYFLLYLNCLRVNEYSGALYYLSLGANPDQQLKVVANQQEEVNKGFRYAALNLAGLHAKYNHKESAMSVLKEAMMMAQEANDHVCLQHALSWLLRVQSDEDPSIQRKLVENMISKSAELQISYGKGLGLNILARLMLMMGDPPSNVWDKLIASDILACQSNEYMFDLISAGFAQKSALWTLYGRAPVSSTISQLLLHFDTATPERDGHLMMTQPMALALCNLVKRLYDTGHGKASDKVLRFASQVFPNTSSQFGTLVHACRLQVQCRRHLHNTDWIEADRCLKALMPIDNTEAKFLKLQLELWQGNANELGKLIKTMRESEDKLSASNKVRLLIYEAEWFSLCGSYSSAIRPLLTAKQVSQTHYLHLLNAMVMMNFAHVKLHLNLPLDALDMVRVMLPLILAHGDEFEIGRAHLLMAKCLVAAAAFADTEESERRINFLAATKHLRKASLAFLAIQSHHRLKDTLYMMARLFHALEMVPERNQASAEFKKVEEEHPTSVASRLAQML